jgi:acid phosphatase type 7
LNGHDHHYERFDGQDSKKTTSTGIREFIVGTGGGEERGLGTTKDNSQVRIADAYGVILLTLHPTSYEWHFIDTDGIVRDSGSEECH